ncbi:SPX and EXS domain-containing protein [Tanacetum coccineum]
MKFGKEFASQMVPEWQEAYMNYNQLKNLVKEILIFRQQQTRSLNKVKPPSKATSLKRKGSIFRAFSGLTSRFGNASVRRDKEEEEVILASAMQHADEEQGECVKYQTIFLRSSDDGGEFELMFFKRLDYEFNKVVNFYREKVEEVVKQAEELNIQMDAFIALRIKVNKPDHAVTPVMERNTGEVSEQHQGIRVDDAKEHKMASLDVLNRIKLNATIDTPISTMRSVFNSLSSDLQFNKNELKESQGKLKKAFIEFYEKLRYLKNYSFLNQLAFSKIMKKYDKIARRNAADAYLQMIEESYLGKSDEVAKLIDRVEAAFIKHFCNGNRSQGMNSLRPKAKREKHRVASLDALTLAAILANLEMDMDPNTRSYKALTELLPLGLVIVVVFIAICPLNLFYRSTRYILLVCIWHCICSPLYTVTLPDFFLADQFTSQVQLLRNLQFYVCYYGWGDFKKRDAQTCNDSDIYKTISIIIAVIPYWIRVLQCVRRYFEGRDSTQALNGLKYFSTIVAVVARSMYSQKQGMILKMIAASTSGIATIFSTYWDLVKDWGLLNKNSENPWLRDKLILPSRSIYFVAMVVNVILRLAWMQTVLDFQEAPSLHRNAVIAIVASLEIIRRGIWNFFRLENEHLNNVGKFRAVKSVPLPFSYEDGDKDL